MSSEQALDKNGFAIQKRVGGEYRVPFAGYYEMCCNSGYIYVDITTFIYK